VGFVLASAVDTLLEIINNIDVYDPWPGNIVVMKESLPTDKVCTARYGWIIAATKESRAMVLVVEDDGANLAALVALLKAAEYAWRRRPTACGARRHRARPRISSCWTSACPALAASRSAASANADPLDTGRPRHRDGPG
jgi:hypothetical protein